MRKVIDTDVDCGIAHILLALQNIRFCSLSNTIHEFQMCLSVLENLEKNNKLNNREKYFSAASIQWYILI